MSMSIILEAGPDFEVYYANYIFLSGTLDQVLASFERLEFIL